MVRKYAAAGLVVLFVILLIAYFPTEKRRVKKLLVNAAGWVTKEGGESPVVIAARSKKAGRFFSPRIDLSIERSGLERPFSIEEIERGYLFLMQQKRVFRVKLADIKIEITGDGTASAEATVLVESEGGGSEGLSNVNEVSFGLRKGDDGWRISSVRVVEVLER